MVLITPDTGHLSAEDVLTSAEELFVAAEKILQDRMHQLDAGGGPVDSETKKDLGAYMRALGYFIHERQEIEKRRAKLDGAASGRSGTVLDLSDARAEIGRRLACLRDAS
ncbi:hypothetical protein [Halocynthiibacter namhaensis]|uniref:hypothetical protein n=1 Tax=Halocynthiibacter namhaensis TaxID=1290553 RepID=UPI00068D0FCB|nr:hypothetical protein [Halocynthiibacter namhaensis]